MKALSSAAGLAALGLLGSCVSGTEGNGGSGACNAFLDSDSDGLDDCTETILGTDPESPDSDGDGMTDAEEAACISNPLDAEELCYACGWVHGDPEPRLQRSPRRRHRGQRRTGRRLRRNR